MKKIKTQNGITLVALVITVIVLLILAGVTLSIVFNGGIIDKSANAVDKYENSSANEKNQINYAENMFEQFYYNAVNRGEVAGGGSGSGSGGGSGSGTAEWVIDTDYGTTGLSLGDLVKPKNLTGDYAYLANEKFYVIGIDGTGATQTVRLLAEKCVKTNDATATNNIQSASANNLYFDMHTVVYADTTAIKTFVDTYVGKIVTAGLALEEVETSEDGTAIGSGTYGRLMWGKNTSGTEIQNVLAINAVGTSEATSITGSTILYGPDGAKLAYWLGSPDGTSYVGCVYGSSSYVGSNRPGTTNAYGLRPVIKVLSSKISAT